MSKTANDSLKISSCIFGVLFIFTVLSAVIMSNLSVSATDGNTSVEDTVTITIDAACTLSGTGADSHTASLQPGIWTPDIGISNITAICNDPGGYAIYAIGYSNDSYDSNVNTNLYATVGTDTYTIPTDDYTSSPSDSFWSMKLAQGTGDAATIISPYNSYSAVPSTYTKVATYPSTTAGTSGSSFTSTYGVYPSLTQAAGTYTGQVKYTLVHPNNAPAPTVPINLYNAVATMSKGKQTAAQLRAAITIPTSADRTEDTSNSGVYEYDPSVFGTASDASNANKIYYYRGVLENSPGTYGSDGSAVTYPNYVVLSSAADSSGLTTSDTCWRIVRTTGSGGVKMVYNGLWTGTTCANTTTNAQVTDSAYNGTSSTYQRIALVGYTYNPTYGDANVTTSTSVDDVFGNNSNYSANSSNSTIKGYIENTWFSNISAYESILEPSAGYCNDRTAYSDNTTSTALSTIVPYATSSDTVFFGAYGRNANATNAGKAPSLTCPSNRNVVDLYTASSASNGNKQLTKPAALLTADEVSLAGSGQTTPSKGSSYHTNSFLRSGSSFWLLSPSHRSSGGYAGGFGMGLYGGLFNETIANQYGVRPVISLTSGTTATSGSGIATDPWIVDAP